MFFFALSGMIRRQNIAGGWIGLAPRDTQKRSMMRSTTVLGNAIKLRREATLLLWWGKAHKLLIANISCPYKCMCACVWVCVCVCLTFFPLCDSGAKTLLLSCDGSLAFDTRLIVAEGLKAHLSDTRRVKDLCCIQLFLFRSLSAWLDNTRQSTQTWKQVL